MKVEIVGAGPAGPLPRDPAEEARPRRTTSRVLERNAPDATFGFGVVFSRGDARRARATPTPRRTSRSRTRSRAGTGSTSATGARARARAATRFSAIARKRLLEILQRRAAASSASTLALRRRGRRSLPRRPTSSSARTASNSLVRAARERLRRPTVAAEGCKYVWFGTDLVFDAFTFAFRETEHGLFNAHAYPYDERMSTFIVECPESGVARGRASTRWTSRRASRSASSCSRTSCAAASSSRTARCGSTSRRSRTRPGTRERRPARRRRAHRALLDRLGDEARDGGLDRARGRSGAAALGPERGIRRLRAGARAVRRAHAGRGQRERRVLRADRELLAPRADPVRVQPDHAERPDHARDAGVRDPQFTRALDAWLGGRAGLAAAGVLAVRAPRRAVREPLRARRKLGRGQPGGPHFRRGRRRGPRASSCFA